MKSTERYRKDLVGGLVSFRDAQERHRKAQEALLRKKELISLGVLPKPKNTAKTVVIYSGKGGVGKTTTAANIARALLAKGLKVAIIDGDVNTPSMGVLFPADHGIDNLLVCSAGYQAAIFVQASAARKYFRDAVKSVLKFKPDVLLIDTPPSITDVHISMIETLQPSGLILVSQPTELSMADVSRTVWFFESHKIPILGLVRSMVTPESPTTDTVYEILGDVAFDSSFDGRMVYEKNVEVYVEVAERVLTVKEADLKVTKRVLFDETITELGDVITTPGFKPRFLNLSTWEQVRNYLMSPKGNAALFIGGLPPDRLLFECTLPRVERLVRAFEHDEEAHFLVTRSPNTEIRLVPGEIGQCRMRQHPGYYHLPVVDYHTSRGTVTLFPHEVMPATEVEISDCQAHGGCLLKDGRLLPGRPTVQALFNAYGDAIGLDKNWEVWYDQWLMDEAY